MKYDADDLILLNMAGIGYIRLGGLIDYFGGIKRLLKAPPAELERVEDIGPVLAKKVSCVKDREGLEKERKLIKKHGVSILTIFDKEYPEALKNIYDPPIVLYVKGRILPQDKIAVALVGSRRASNYGFNVCRGLSESLASLGVTVVSGLARGIDSAAHKGALDAGGRTLAVLGNGLSTLYPPENRNLAERIACSGALISEFPMEYPPISRNFPIRNRVISGLSLGVVIVEAAKKSGALITAGQALEQGREVFAVPGKAGSATSSGTHSLIKNGARLVDSAEDILEELNLKPLVKGYKLKGIDSSRLEKNEKIIYDILSDEPEHIDSIITRSNLPHREVTNLLLRLEVKKLIKELPGKNFIKNVPIGVVSRYG